MTAFVNYSARKILMATHFPWVGSMPVGRRGMLKNSLHHHKKLSRIGSCRFLQLPIMTEKELFELAFYKVLKKLLRIPKYDDMKVLRSFFIQNNRHIDGKITETSQELSPSLSDEVIFVLENMRSYANLCSLVKETDKFLIVQNFSSENLEKVKTLISTMGTIDWLRLQSSTKDEEKELALVKMTKSDDSNFVFTCLDGYLVDGKLLHIIKVKDIIGGLNENKPNRAIKDVTQKKVEALPSTQLSDYNNHSLKSDSNNLQRTLGDGDDQFMSMIERNIMGIIGDVTPEKEKKLPTSAVKNRIKELININTPISIIEKEKELPTSEIENQIKRMISIGVKATENDCRLANFEQGIYSSKHKDLKVVEDDLRRILKIDDIESSKIQKEVKVDKTKSFFDNFI